MTKAERDTKRVSKFLARVARIRHEEHAKLPGDKRGVKDAELRNNLLEDV